MLKDAFGRFSTIILSRFFLNLREASLDKAGIPSSIDSGSQIWSNMRFAGRTPAIGSILALPGDDEDDTYEDESDSTAVAMTDSQSRGRSTEQEVSEVLQEDRHSHVLDA